MSAVVDSSQQVVATYQYNAFGRLMQESGTFEQPFRFSTKRYDAGTGLAYYGYRFYAPAIERWLNRDPLGEAGGINLYGFVSNDPVNFFDPWGLEVRNPSTGVPVYVKPEDNSKPIGILPPGYTWPGSPDGTTPVDGNDDWDKYAGKEYTPANCVELDDNGKGKCVGGTCLLPIFGQTTKPRSDPDWPIPNNPQILPGIIPYHRPTPIDGIAP